MSAATAGAPPASAHRLGAFLVLAAATLYFVTFVRYGFHLGEDGDVVYLIFRTLAGQRPYLDFASGYTPGFYYGHALLLRLFGEDLVVLRWALVAVHALTALCLYLLAARAVPPLLAAVPALANVALLPLYAGRFATFNIPYPAWHVVLFWAASLLAFLRWRDAGRARWLFAAGVLAGLGCAFKPNTGAFNLAALALALLAAAARPPGALERAAWWGLLAGVLLALLALFGFDPGRRDARLLLYPVFALAAVIALRPPRAPQPARRAFAARVAALLGGFALVNAPWMTWFLLELGPQRFLRDVLYLGTGHALFFYLPIPPLGAADAAVAAALLALAAASRLPLAWWRRWALPLAAAALLALAGAALALRAAPMPEGFERAVTSRLEQLAFGAAIAVHWAGVAFLALRRRAAPDYPATRGDDAELLALISAPLLFVSIYPRSDFFHFVLSAPLTLVLAVLLYGRVARRWAEGRVRLAWAAVPLYAGLALLWLPELALAARLWRTPAAELAHLGLPRGDVLLEGGRARTLDSLRQTVELVQQHSRPGDTLLGFPNLHLLNLLADRHVPGRHGSFHPGWPDHVIEAEIVDALDRRRTPLVVINRSPQLYIGNAPVYYFLLTDYLQRNFRLLARAGDFEVLKRAAPGEGAERAASGEGAERSRAALHAALQTGGDCAVALARVRAREAEDAAPLAPCWRPENGALQEAAVQASRAAGDPAAAAALAAALADGRLTPAAALLAARAIGEAGDARSVPAAVRALEVTQGRVRDELTTAIMNVAVRSYFDGHHLRPSELGFEAIRADDRLGTAALLWLDGDDPRLRYAGAWLAGVRREPTAVDGLRRLLRAGLGLEFVALAADSLRRIGVHDGVAEVLIDGMQRDELYLPTALWLWSRENPDEARALLAQHFRDGNPLQRESIAFVAGALGDPRLAEAVRAGIDDPSARVRMASLWAVGVLGDAQARPAVERAAAGDEVEQVREFAARALTRIERERRERP